MLDGRTLWELIERRATEAPAAEMAVDEDGRCLTFGEYRDACERAAAGLAKLGVGTDDVVSWQLPTWVESLVLVGALARLGATQNPILPIYRTREVGFVVRQAGSRLLIVPSTWKGFDFGAMAGEIAGEVEGLEGLLRLRAAAPEVPDPGKRRGRGGNLQRRQVGEPHRAAQLQNGVTQRGHFSRPAGVAQPPVPLHAAGFA
ncbi:MAG TPA: AMP-binding protein, partial [Acidimicrobiales bacterium]|nr:AMP-binding protein [Acidimicrobiales bacterium]